MKKLMNMAKVTKDSNVISVPMRPKVIQQALTPFISSSIQFDRSPHHSHDEDNSLKGVNRISSKAYGPVASIVQAAHQKAQTVHNEAIKGLKPKIMDSEEL